MQSIRLLILLCLIGLSAACRPALLPAPANLTAPAPGAQAKPAPLALPTPTPMPAPTATAAPAPAPTAFPVGAELTIAALLEREIVGSPITIEQQLADGANYAAR